MIEIVSIEEGICGWSCEEQYFCGGVMEEDIVVCLQKVVQVLVDGKEETAIAAYWVTDGEECCRVMVRCCR